MNDVTYCLRNAGVNTYYCTGTEECRFSDRAWIIRSMIAGMISAEGEWSEDVTKTMDDCEVLREATDKMYEAVSALMKLEGRDHNGELINNGTQISKEDK